MHNGSHPLNRVIFPTKYSGLNLTLFVQNCCNKKLSHVFSVGYFFNFVTVLHIIILKFLTEIFPFLIYLFIFQMSIHPSEAFNDQSKPQTYMDLLNDLTKHLHSLQLVYDQKHSLSHPQCFPINISWSCAQPHNIQRSTFLSQIHSPLLTFSDQY